MPKVCVTLVRSVIGRPRTQRACVQSLGLRKLNQSRVMEAHPAIMGNVRKVIHLLRVEELKDGGK